MSTFRLLTGAVVLAHLLVPQAEGRDHPATRVVEQLHSKLISVMQQAEELDYTGRYDRLTPVITTSFDLPFIARIVMGRHWSGFDEGQRSEFVDIFTRLSIATYADRFDAYSGERFEVLSERELRRSRILVGTVLVKASGEEVHLDYVLHHKDHTWRIINVIADGVSDLSLKHADYTSFFSKNGFDALVDKLREKVARYAD
jgi:phospholipid transport system substrate-binding protein